MSELCQRNMSAVDQGQVSARCLFADALAGLFGGALGLGQGTDIGTLGTDAAALGFAADSCVWELVCDTAQWVGHFDASALSAGQPKGFPPDSTA